MTAVSIREKKRRKAFPLKRTHSFPSVASPTEWAFVHELDEFDNVVSSRRPVSFDSQLYRWLRTQGFRTLNAGFDFSIAEDVSDLEDAYTVEQIALALHLRDLALEHADAPAVVDSRWVEHEFHYEDPELEALLGGVGAVRIDTELAPAIERSGISFEHDPANKRSREEGVFDHDDLIGKCLRVSS